MLKVVVVDDESASREAIVRLIARHPTLHLVGQANSAASGAALIARVRPDAVFLDVQMAGSDGFRLLAELPVPPKVVFVTAHAAYATRAFDVEAVDFLLKPVQPERFARSVRRLQKLLAPRAPANAPPLAQSASLARGSLTLPIARGTRIIALDDILFVQADRDDSRVRLAGDTECIVRRSIGDLAALLPTPPFLRTHRSLIVHTARIVAFETVTRDQTRLSLDGTTSQLLLGRTGGTTLRQYLARRR